MNYFRFTEHNEWEGETWHFYIPATDENLKAADGLIALLEDQDLIPDAFEVDTSTMTEQDIDALVVHSEVGYMRMHNKLSGVLDFEAINDSEDVSQALYKGGIEGFMI